MNHFLRMLLLAIQAAFLPRVGLLDPVTISLSVWFTDENVHRHMDNSRYASLADLALVNWTMRTRAMGVTRAKRWTPVAVFKSMTFHKMLRFPQRYDITTQAVAWTNRFVLYRSTFERRGERVADGWIVFRFVDSGRGLVSVDELHRAVTSGPAPASPSPEPEAAAILERMEALADARKARHAAT